MPPMLLRPAQPADDAAVARIFTAIEPDPVTPEQVRNWEESFPRGGVQLRLVAVDEEERVAGWGLASHTPYQKEGEFRLYAVTDSPLRNRGIGTALAEAVEQFAREHGATELTTSARDTEEFSLRFAAKRGFHQTSHLFESLLDLSTFDEARFSGVVEAAEATGIRFATLDQVPDVGRLYEIHKATVPDQPGYGATSFPDQETWADRVLRKNAQFRPDACWIALDGDRFVAVSRTSWREPASSMYTDFTGVLPAYRGRNLALALKLLTIRTALRYGACYMRTNNDSRNAPMIAVNQRLGYVGQPGWIKMSLVRPR